MKQFLKKVIPAILYLPSKKSIVFESNPEFTCNSLPVYEEMVRRGIDKDYQIYWLVEDKTKYLNSGLNVKFLNYEEQGFDKFKKFLILSFSKCLVFTNRFLFKIQRNQFVINLSHGMPLKNTPGYVEGDTCDYVVLTSDTFKQSMSEALEVPIEKTISLGYPRTDVFKKQTDARKKMNIQDDNKLIVWMPTFRRRKDSKKSATTDYDFGIPLIDTEEKFDSLNEQLKVNKCILVVKLHPVEDVSNKNLKDYSNIYFYNDTMLNEHGTTTYELLADSDALLTDYSTVYYDYLLMNKPIGLVINDLEEYSKKIGFALGEYKDFMKGSYIENMNDFDVFIENLHKEIDPDEKGREWAREQYCQFTDFNSTNRVVDLIMEHI